MNCYYDVSCYPKSRHTLLTCIILFNYCLFALCHLFVSVRKLTSLKLVTANWFACKLSSNQCDLAAPYKYPHFPEFIVIISNIIIDS